MQSFFTASISSVVTGGFGMAIQNSTNKAVGQVLFGTFAGGITAELSGGNPDSYREARCCDGFDS